MSFQELIMTLANAKSAKAVFSILIGWFTSWIIPIAQFLIVILFLIVADFITGVGASHKRAKDAGESFKFSASGMRRTIQKGAYYMLAILLAHAMQYVFLPAVPLAYMTAFYIAATEFKSNMENIATITGTNAWKAVGKVFRKILTGNEKD